MKTINNSAPVKSEKSIVIKSDIEKVWQILTDIDNWSNWNSDISKSKINNKIQTGRTFSWKTGGAKLQSKIHTYNPVNEFGWTGKFLGAYAIHNWRLSYSDKGTIVKVSESMEGFLTKVFQKSFQQTLEKRMNKWLKLLKQECEKQAFLTKN